MLSQATHSSYCARVGPGKLTTLLSAFCNGLFANVMLGCFCFPPQCDISMLPAGGDGGGKLRKQKVR
jgi:hypothetical protein